MLRLVSLTASSILSLSLSHTHTHSIDRYIESRLSHLQGIEWEKFVGLQEERNSCISNRDREVCNWNQLKWAQRGASRCRCRRHRYILDIECNVSPAAFSRSRSSLWSVGRSVGAQPITLWSMCSRLFWQATWTQPARRPTLTRL